MRPHRQSSCLRAGRGWTERGGFESRERLPIFCAPARFRQGHRDRRTRSSLRNPNELQSRRVRSPAADGEKDCLRAYAARDERAAVAKRIAISGPEAMPATDVSRQRGAWAAAAGGKRSCAHANGLRLGGGYSIHQGSGGRAQARGERDGYYIQFRAVRNPGRLKRRQDAGWTYSHSVTS